MLLFLANAGETSTVSKTKRAPRVEEIMHSTMFAVLASMVAIGIQAQPPAVKKSESGLAGTSWQLVRIQYMDDKVLTPDDPAKYTLAFGTDGRVSMRIDCNRAT